MRLTAKISAAAALAAAALLVSGCAQDTPAQKQSADLVTMEPTARDVLLDTVKDANGADRPLRLNIFVPPQAQNAAVPVLIYVHGGGWAKGDYQGNDRPGLVRPESGDQMSRDFNKTYDVFKSVLNDGIAFVSVDYRLNSEDVFPAPLFDVKGAIRYVRAHANDYGIDPDRIAIAGSSAGAHLACEAALTAGIPELEGTVGGNAGVSSKVMVVVDYYGPTDLLTMAPEMSPKLQDPQKAAQTHDSVTANESLLLGAVGGAKAKGVGELRRIRDRGLKNSPHWPEVVMAEQASPVNQVTKDAPPFFIAHGGRDSLVPIAQSLRLQQKLTENGVANLFMCNSEAPHGYQGENVNRAMRDWLKDRLLGNQ